MAIRYTDLDIATSGARDFVIRKRSPTLLQLFIIFLSVLLIAISVTLTVADKLALIMIMFVTVASVGWYVIIQIQRSRDMVLATEFQNSLFASALGINNKFCIIIRRDGNIVYLDRSFQDMFPDFLKQSRRSIDILLEQGKVSRPDSEKIYSAIERGVYEKVIFDIRGSGNVYHKIVMSIEPILRPSGFILLRGREFVEARSNEDLPATTRSALLNKGNITLFSYVMDTMHMGVYMAGPAGNIIHANPVLEQWLEYNDGEITLSNLSLQDIISQGGNRAESIEPENYEGEVTLQKKTGGTMKAFINQKVIRDENNKVMGCTALVHNFVEQGPNVKKKLW
jgi:two-component system, cell cycle sensor histidine kinase and response regulator CckA